MSGRLLFVSFAMVLALSACGGGSSGGVSPTTGESAEQTPAAPAPAASAPASTASAPAPAASAPAPQPTALQPGIQLLAGDIGGSGALDGTGTEARFQSPHSISIDAAGNLYLADAFLLRRIDAEGRVSTLAGVPAGFGNVDGTGPTARVQNVDGLVAMAGGDAFFTQDYKLRKVTASGVVTTLSGLQTSPGDVHDGPLSNASFYKPGAITRDGQGNLYLIDETRSAIVKISTSGIVSTIASLSNVPTGLVVDDSGTIWVVSQFTKSLQKVTPDGVVSTVVADVTGGPGPGTVARQLVIAGPGRFQVTNGNTIMNVSVDGMVSVFADLQRPLRGLAAPVGITGLARSPSGDLFATYDDEVLRITPDGAVSTFAGRSRAAAAYVDGVGAAARFLALSEVAGDVAGNAYVLDGGRVLRRIAPDGTVSTIAGNPDESGYADGTGAQVRFAGGTGITLDQAGNVIVGSGSVIRKVTPQGVATTLAGSPGTSGTQDGQGANARFVSPARLATAADGSIIIADGTFATLVRKLTPSGTVTTVGQVTDHQLTFCQGSCAQIGEVLTNPAGEVLVSGMAGAGGGRLGTFDASGALRLTSQSPVKWHTADSRGNLYGEDGGRIWRLTPAGEITQVAGSGSGTPPGASSATGIRLGPLPGSFSWISDIVALPLLPGTTGTRLLVTSENAVLLVTLPD